MTNPDTTSPQPQTPTATFASTDPVKPGFMTTEFWLKVAAFALTALFASGVIPTTGTVATITAIAATMLGALGYTVSRTFIKVAAVLALVVLALGSGSMLCACSSASLKADVTKAEHAIVDCTKLDAPQLEAALLQVAVDAVTYTLKLGHVDWPALEATAENDGSDIATCAFVEYQAAQSTTVSRVANAAPAPDPSAAAVARLRGKLGGPVWHTAHGDI